MIHTAKSYFRVSNPVNPKHLIEVCKVSDGQVEFTVEDSGLFSSKKLKFGLGKSEIKKLIKTLEQCLEK